jgi:hypothetical protein
LFSAGGTSPIPPGSAPTVRVTLSARDASTATQAMFRTRPVDIVTEVPEHEDRDSAHKRHRIG